MMGNSSIAKKNNVTIIYDCKYSQGDYGFVEVEGDVSVFRLGGFTTFEISPKTAFGPLCGNFYILNLVGNWLFQQNALQADSYTSNGRKIKPKRPAENYQLLYSLQVIQYVY